MFPGSTQRDGRLQHETFYDSVRIANKLPIRLPVIFTPSVRIAERPAPYRRVVMGMGRVYGRNRWV